MKKIVVIGEILVEIMADTVGNGFGEPQPLTGPFPSGAPAIFADQAARLGQPVGIFSAVGDDDFGRINLDRLARDGVDISAVRVHPDRPTGTAFVRYRADGSRDFVFNIRHSASGHLKMTPEAKRLLDSADHLHVTGSSLTSSELIELNTEAGSQIKRRGGTLSFDPNIRKEFLASRGVAHAMARILALTDLFLPSGDELTLLTEAKDPAGAIAELFNAGVSAVVHKNGAAGARYQDAQTSCVAPSFQVTEVDSTGAGDCFGAAFTALWLRGSSPQHALALAAAAGAHAVTKQGPMEGASDLETLEAFVRANSEVSR